MDIRTPLGVTVNVVKPGAVIRDDKTGEEATVTETSAVFKGWDCYVTQGMYEALKAKATPRRDRDGG